MVTKQVHTYIMQLTPHIFLRICCTSLKLVYIHELSYKGVNASIQSDSCNLSWLSSSWSCCLWCLNRPPWPWQAWPISILSMVLSPTLLLFKWDAGNAAKRSFDGRHSSAVSDWAPGSSPTSGVPLNIIVSSGGEIERNRLKCGLTGFSWPFGSTGPASNPALLVDRNRRWLLQVGSWIRYLCARPHMDLISFRRYCEELMN